MEEKADTRNTQEPCINDAGRISQRKQLENKRKHLIKALAQTQTAIEILENDPSLETKIDKVLEGTYY